MAASISSKEACGEGASTASYLERSMAAILIGLSWLGDFAMPSSSSNKRGDVKSEEAGSRG